MTGLYTSRLGAIADAIRHLEEKHTGLLRFSVHGYLPQFVVSTGGWQDVRYLCELPDLRQFADELNAATAPVIQAYCKRLRQELANRSIKLAAESLGAGVSHETE